MLKLTRIFPLQQEVVDIIKKYKRVFVFEESSREGSIGEKICQKAPGAVCTAIEGFVPGMSVYEAIDLYGLNKDRIVEAVRSSL